MAGHKFDPEKAERLIAPERYHRMKPDVLLQILGLPPGSTILDLGCGNGFFTFPASAAMGEDGRVIAADTSQEMLDLLGEREPRLNVQLLLVEEVAIDLSDDEVDGAVLINVFHEFHEPEQNLRELYRVLRPGGKLMVVDWLPDQGLENGPPQEHRVPRATAEELIEGSGFVLDKCTDYEGEWWLILAHRP